jgi:hypothetical protein
MGWGTDRTIFFQSARYNTEQANHFQFSKEKKKEKLSVNSRQKKIQIGEFFFLKNNKKKMRSSILTIEFKCF